MPRLTTAIGLLAVVLAAARPGCRKPVQVDEPPGGNRSVPVTSRPTRNDSEHPPAKQPATRLATRPSVPEPRVRSVAAPESGWLQIDSLRDNVKGGWATGDVDGSRNKIIIETRSVEQFAIDLQKIRVRWDRRVVLQINDQVMELTRKRNPVVRFRQTPTGGWNVVRP